MWLKKWEGQISLFYASKPLKELKHQLLLLHSEGRKQVICVWQNCFSLSKKMCLFKSWTHSSLLWRFTFILCWQWNELSIQICGLNCVEVHWVFVSFCNSCFLLFWVLIALDCLEFGCIANSIWNCISFSNMEISWVLLACHEGISSLPP